LDLTHRRATHPYEHAHATPYYYQKDEWPSMIDTPDKGPVTFLEKQIEKYDRINNLENMAIRTPNICNGQEMNTLTKNCPMNFGITILLLTSKNEPLGAP
jgi:hypothetical protein